MLDFLPHAPTSEAPEASAVTSKAGPPQAVNGRASLSTYSLRKIEVALLKHYQADEVVLAHENHLKDFVDDETDLSGVSTMDALGLGPSTMS